MGNAGFSLGIVGFKPEPVFQRKELSSAEERYFKSCDPKNYESVDEGWRAWLVIMQAETNKRIKSQEIVPVATGSLLKTTDKKNPSAIWIGRHRYWSPGAIMR